MNCNQKQHGNRNKLVRGKRSIMRRDKRKDVMILDQHFGKYVYILNCIALKMNLDKGEPFSESISIGIFYLFTCLRLLPFVVERRPPTSILQLILSSTLFSSFFQFLFVLCLPLIPDGMYCLVCLFSSCIGKFRLGIAW